MRQTCVTMVTPKPVSEGEMERGGGDGSGGVNRERYRKHAVPMVTQTEGS